MWQVKRYDYDMVPGSEHTAHKLLPAGHSSNCISPESGQHQATAMQAGQTRPPGREERFCTTHCWLERAGLQGSCISLCVLLCFQQALR